MSAPTYRFLSLGAGIQSSTLVVLAAQGRIPTSRVPLDQAVLKPRTRDTGDMPRCGPWSCPRAAANPAAVPAESSAGRAVVPAGAAREVA